MMNNGFDVNGKTYYFNEEEYEMLRKFKNDRE